jgi:protein-disulfide isomerase
MRYIFWIITVLLILAAGYSLIGIGHFKWMYHSVNNPRAEFLVSGDKTSDIIVIEFLNYGCGYCKELHPIIKELQQVRKDVRYVTRPIIFDDDPSKEKASRIVIAAGLQGKFNEIHEAFLEYPEEDIPDNFIEETALLYGLDYERLIKDSNGKEVLKILDNNLAALEHVGITSVPSLMIGDKIYIATDSGLPDLKQLLNLIANASK